VLAEALATGVVPLRVFVAADRPPPVPDDGAIEIVTVTAAVLARISGTETPQGVVAVIAVPEPGLPAGGGLLVAWGVSDPGNVGTLVRSAAAFGLGFAAGPGCADPWSPKVVRSGAGAHFRTPIGRVAALDELGPRVTVAAVARGGDPSASLRGLPDAAILVGDEASGLPGEIAAAADRRVTVPMPGGTESLNAAVAGSILAYEAAGGGGRPMPD
jgi:TrmH family RNA methyltransferase